MLYQGQYHLMSGPEPCQENLFSRFSRYVDSCCVGREQPASAPASISSASVFDCVIFFYLCPPPSRNSIFSLLSGLSCCLIAFDMSRVRRYICCAGVNFRMKSAYFLSTSARLFAAFSRESCPSSFAALSRLFRCRSRSAWTAPCCGETLPGQTA